MLELEHDKWLAKFENQTMTYVAEGAQEQNILWRGMYAVMCKQICTRIVDFRSNGVTTVSIL
jgi:outer membrane lipopolysaccharide assembly protein LptE/RlpB